MKARIHKLVLWKLFALIGIFIILVMIQASRVSFGRGQGLSHSQGDENVPASTIVVNTFNDELTNDGNCSLREAVQAANTESAVDACTAGSGADTISLPAGIYILSIAGSSEDNNQTGDLDVTGVLTITGDSRDTTFIQGGTDSENGIDRVLDALPDSHLTVEYVTIRYGKTASGGSPHINGGGIYVDMNGELDINHCNITDNYGENGGGVYYYFSTVHIDDSLISNNMGFSGGGGIRGFGTVTITNSTLANNMGSFGGGVLIESGTVAINASTISDNSTLDPFMGGYGGGIDNNDTLSITNSTISGNIGDNQGGGIRNLGTMFLRNSTITGNSSADGAGISSLEGELTVTNSIIADNFSGGDCHGTINSDDYNLDSDNSCSLTRPHDLPGVDPDLAPLGDNGGPTRTHALLLYSLALQNGNCSGGAVLVDQRGISRPQGYACDIGSVEYQGPPYVFAMTDIYTTTQNIPLQVPAPGVRANDYSFYTTTVTLAHAPQKGTIDLMPNGDFVYTPTLNYYGLDAFTYLASDGLLTSTSIVTITVNPANFPPVAIGDVYTTTTGITLTVAAPGILWNDYDVDSTTLTPTLVIAPTNGTLLLNTDGSFIYVPDPGFVGVDSFVYTISDGEKISDPATVTINVISVCYLPVVTRSFP